MSVASQPATEVTTLKSKDLHAGGSGALGHGHIGHDITKVGPVNVKVRAGHRGGTFEVWYCQNDDTLFLTITD
jgi:hypothetical protein